MGYICCLFDPSNTEVDGDIPVATSTALSIEFIETRLRELSKKPLPIWPVVVLVYITWLILHQKGWFCWSNGDINNAYVSNVCVYRRTFLYFQYVQDVVRHINLTRCFRCQLPQVARPGRSQKKAIFSPRTRSQKWKVHEVLGGGFKHLKFFTPNLGGRFPF